MLINAVCILLSDAVFTDKYNKQFLNKKRIIQLSLHTQNEGQE